MAQVRFTRHLLRFFPQLSDGGVDAATVAELVSALNRQYPGLAAYLVDEHGALRKHVNIFVNGNRVCDRVTLTDTVAADDTIDIIQALSGG